MGRFMRRLLNGALTAGWFSWREAHAHMTRLRRFGRRLAQRGLANEIRVHFEIDEPVKAQFEWVCLDIHVSVIGLHTTLDPAD